MVKKALLAAILSINLPFGNLAYALVEGPLSACAGHTELTPQLLGQIYQSAFLKIAQRLSLENLRTVEDYAATLSFRLNDETLHQFQQSFNQFGHPGAFAAFIKNLRNAQHWDTQVRFDNSAVAMTALLGHVLGELHLTDSELATLWLSQLDEQTQTEESLSIKLAKISGAFGDKRPLMAQEYSRLLERLESAPCQLRNPDLSKKIADLFWSGLVQGSSKQMISVPAIQLPDQQPQKGSSIEVRFKKDEPAYLYKTYRAHRDSINKLSNIEVIQSFHKFFGDQDYVIVDKKAGVARYFSKDLKQLSSAKVETYPGDELNAGGAGIYFYAGQKSGYHYLQAHKDQNIRLAFRGEILIPQNTLVYVLPETSNHRFRLKNRSLVFSGAQVYRSRIAFNHAGLSRSARTSKIETYLDESLVQDYVSTLQNEKNRLMNLLNLDNDDYNLLAEFSYGVLAPETDYGNSLKYKLKEQIPFLVALLKGNGLDISSNSRGLTQIKRIPKAVIEAYDIEKADLKEPRFAAIVTLAFSADILRELRNMSHLHPAINEENIQDYLYYLYNGKHSEIRKGTATPDKNISIRKIKSAIAHLFIAE